MTLKSVDGLIFLSFLTKYNLSAIYSILEEYDDMDVAEFLNLYQAKSGSYTSSAIYNNHKHIQDSLEEARISSFKMDFYNVKGIPYSSPDYPAKLKAIKQPPPLLYYRGAGRLRRSKLVAIVGTRNPTKMAGKIIPLLIDVFKRHDYGIVSGLALGIDSIAHREAINQGAYTVAIMPNSLDTIYPKENYSLANQILENKGALVSELAFGISHGKKSFVQRNRIQAGISDFVIPVEMGIKSGTMTTVEFAYAQDKYIFLIPPKGEFVNYEQYEGVNHFLSLSTQNKYKKTYKITELSDLDTFLSTNTFSEQSKLF